MVLIQKLNSEGRGKKRSETTGIKKAKYLKCFHRLLT